MRLYHFAPLICCAALVGTEAAAQSCTNQSRSNIAGLAVQPCTTKDLSTRMQGDLSGYYGQVQLTATSGGDFAVDKSFGKFLREYFALKDDFDAVVAIELYKEGALIYQRPLFVASIDRGNGTKASINNVLAAATPVSPFFRLDQGQEELKAKLKVSVVNKRSGEVLSTIKQGVDAAAALGGHGWLVTAVAADALMKSAAKAEAALNSYYSYDYGIGTETDLGYAANNYKSVKYTVTIPPADKHSQPVIVEATLDLVATVSLITDLRFTGGDRIIRPQTSRGTAPAGRWADRISLRGNPATTLGDQIDAGGVPRKLEDLKIVPGAKAEDVVARKTQIDASCQALSKAIDSGPFKLSDSDRDLILYDELRRAGIFKLYAPASLDCTADAVGRWAKYQITVPALPDTKPPPRTVPAADKIARLTWIAKHLEVQDQGIRADLLRSDFTTTVRITAQPDFIPGWPAPTVPNEKGLATWDVSPERLAALKKACFGNFKSGADKESEATAFAQFEGDPKSYLVRPAFSTAQSWGPEGPQVESLSITEATPEERRAYDSNGKCLG
jgi:hypothetical protein